MPKNKEGIYEVLHKTITGILIPVVFYLLGQIGAVQKDLNTFQVKVAAEYSRNEQVVRIENKIDDLRLIIIKTYQGEDHARKSN